MPPPLWGPRQQVGTKSNKQAGNNSNTRHFFLLCLLTFEDLVNRWAPNPINRRATIPVQDIFSCYASLPLRTLSTGGTKIKTRNFFPVSPLLFEDLINRWAPNPTRGIFSWYAYFPLRTFSTGGHLIHFEAIFPNIPLPFEDLINSWAPIPIREIFSCYTSSPLRTSSTGGHQIQYEKFFPVMPAPLWWPLQQVGTKSNTIHFFLIFPSPLRTSSTVGHQIQYEALFPLSWCSPPSLRISSTGGHQIQYKVFPFLISPLHLRISWTGGHIPSWPVSALPFEDLGNRWAPNPKAFVSAKEKRREEDRCSLNFPLRRIHQLHTHTQSLSMIIQGSFCVISLSPWFLSLLKGVNSL